MEITKEGDKKVESGTENDGVEVVEDYEERWRRNSWGWDGDVISGFRERRTNKKMAGHIARALEITQKLLSSGIAMRRTEMW